MRYLLIKGKQKELLKKEKESLKLNWEQFSNFFGIKKGNILSYYHEQSLIPKELFDNLLFSKEYSQYIIESKNEYWGRSLGGYKSKGNTKDIVIPENSNKLAELWGILLGDGNLTKIKSNKIGVYSIRIVGDANKDKDYLLNYVKPLIEELFHVNVKVYYFKKNALYLSIASKKLVNFFEINGFKSGNKIKNNLTIPLWIKNDDTFLVSCIRGLYDTDGSVYKLTNQSSIQINFSNRNKILLNDVRNSLIKIDINPSKVTKDKEFNITKKSELEKFLKQVGFKNSKHLNKMSRYF